VHEPNADSVTPRPNRRARSEHDPLTQLGQFGGEPGDLGIGVGEVSPRFGKIDLILSIPVIRHRCVVQKQASALIITPGNLFIQRRVQIAVLAVRDSVPAIYVNRVFPEAGGLMSYGSDWTDTFRQAGIYCGRVLKGEKPADLPVLQQTKFHLVINLNTANALRLQIPPTLLALADEVIE